MLNGFDLRGRAMVDPDHRGEKPSGSRSSDSRDVECGAEIGVVRLDRTDEVERNDSILIPRNDER